MVPIDMGGPRLLLPAVPQSGMTPELAQQYGKCTPLSLSLSLVRVHGDDLYDLLKTKHPRLHAQTTHSTRTHNAYAGIKSEPLAPPLSPVGSLPTLPTMIREQLAPPLSPVGSHPQFRRTLSTGRVSPSPVVPGGLSPPSPNMNMTEQPTSPGGIRSARSAQASPNAMRRCVCVCISLSLRIHGDDLDYGLWR